VISSDSRCIYFMTLQISQKQIKSLLKPQSGSMMARRGRSGSRSRSRSRSKSRGKSSEKKVNGAHMRSAMARKDMVKRTLPRLSSLRALIGAKEKETILAKATYFDKKDSKIDLKNMDDQIAVLKKELELAVGALRAGLGNKPIRIRLSAELLITTTVTSGVTNTIQNGGTSSLSPTNCTEWSTMAALFEEYKCLGGEARFVYCNPSVGSTPPTVVANNLPVIAYDADDNTQATSSILLTQTAQHEVLGSIMGPTLSTPTTAGTHVDHRFRWRTPRGTAVGGGTTATPGTEWIAVSGAQPAGYIKFYHVGTTVTAITTGAGFMYYDLEFRCRA